MTWRAPDHLASQALTYWAHDPGVAPRLISLRENAVFEVRLDDGRAAALRLHRPGYNSEAEIRSELWWTGTIAARGFPVPRPIAAKDSNPLVSLEGGNCATMLEWVDGEPVGASGDPLGGTAFEQQALFREIGRLLARLHEQSDRLDLPDWFQRRNWNIDGFLGTDPLWGRFWENPGLTPSGRALLQTARTAARSDLADYVGAGADTGLIHADALRENVFHGQNGLTLIDFDDAGFGFRLFDLTTAVSQSIEDDTYPALRNAVVEGYRERRGLTEQEHALLPLFAMLRTFASVGWVMPRLPKDHPGIPRFIRRAELAAQSYLDAR